MVSTVTSLNCLTCTGRVSWDRDPEEDELLQKTESGVNLFINSRQEIAQVFFPKCQICPLIGIAVHFV